MAEEDDVDWENASEPGGKYSMETRVTAKGEKYEKAGKEGSGFCK